MPLTTSLLSQASLAAAIGLSAVGIWAGTQPPNPAPEKAPATGDAIRPAIVLGQTIGHFIYLPLGIVAAQHMALALTYPRFPSWMLRLLGARHLQANNSSQIPDARFFTWSKQTVLSIALIVCVGTPLRLVSYGALGKDFTFALAEPDALNTTGGLYRWIQHPSYTGALALVLGALGLWGSVGSVPGVLLPPSSQLAKFLRRYERVIIVLGFALALSVVWRRVRDEEAMLANKFGDEWQDWHARTARFIPFIF